MTQLVIVAGIVIAVGITISVEVGELAASILFLDTVAVSAYRAGDVFKKPGANLL